MNQISLCVCGLVLAAIALSGVEAAKIQKRGTWCEEDLDWQFTLVCNALKRGVEVADIEALKQDEAEAKAHLKTRGQIVTLGGWRPATDSLTEECCNEGCAKEEIIEQC